MYDTEEQQVEAIKRWWQENGNFVIVGIAVGLAVVLGWRLYQDNELSNKEAASSSYQALQTSIDAKGYGAAAELQAYIDSNKGSNYSFMAALQLAKLAVDGDKFAEAEAQLSYVISAAAANNPLLPVAVLRLARIQVTQAKYDEALATLTATTLDVAFTATVEELKGDIYVAQNATEKARIAYQAAIDNGGLENNAVLQTKINQLSVIEAAQ
ncbi:tetratricopeptide repeat protein [Corallincola luteus]|uniref:Ancillary SecYEG translocon subunit n=1 Tax=Corallincola luteus TaxID=1775177 RepID=A0ABY2AH13_9GAMM|nr:tetratricopeptide repeat protein [Corallincola luteus]TCI01655.1 tetratricopeptide repeat protein [Corallincola luteus]